MLFFLFSIKSREFSTNFPMLHRFSNYFFFYPWEWDDFPVDLFPRHVRSFIYSFIFSNYSILKRKTIRLFAVVKDLSKTFCCSLLDIGIFCLFYKPPVVGGGTFNARYDLFQLNIGIEVDRTS